MTDHPVTAPEPWPSWLADLTPEDRVRKVVRAVAACYGGDSHDQPATQHCSIGVAEMFLSRLLDEARQQAPVPSTFGHAEAVRIAQEVAGPGVRVFWHAGGLCYHPESPVGNPVSAVPSEPVLDAVTRMREWAAAEPSGLMLRRDVVGTLDRVLAMSPERAAELADYRGRIAKAVALLHQSSEYAISDALAGLLTRILSDPPRTGSGPARGEGRRGRI